MYGPALILLVSLGGVAAALLAPGPQSGGLLLLSAACALAALFLLFRAIPRARPAYIVVDGSNVLHWDAETPALATVGHVVEDLRRRGLTPVVWFDANVGYKVGDRYLGPGPLSRALGVEERQVFVAPKGTPADPLLLDGATRLNARVVTNDRYRDWTDAHPRVTEPGFLVRGEMREGRVRLELGE